MTTSTISTHWHILGAGAMGCLWAAHMEKSAIPVTLLVKQPIAAQQLKLSYPTNLSFSAPVQPLSPQQVESEISQLLLCCKAQDSLAALQSIAPLLGKQCRVVLCQNGMGSQQQLIETYPTVDIYCASTTEGAYLNSPFQITHAGKGQTWIGKLNTTTEDHSEALAVHLSSSGLIVNADPNINQRLWHKLAINGSINGLTALYQCRNGELLTNAVFCARMNALSDETRHLLNSLGIPYDKPLRDIVQDVARSTSANYSSTYQDALHHRPTELAYINGYLLQQAAAIEMHLPHHLELMADLKSAGIE